jgi:hypothetical protein
VLSLLLLLLRLYLFMKCEGVSKNFRTESITKYTLTTINSRWEASQRVLAAELTRLTHKIAIQLHLVAERCTICSSGSTFRTASGLSSRTKWGWESITYWSLVSKCINTAMVWTFGVGFAKGNRNSLVCCMMVVNVGGIYPACSCWNSIVATSGFFLVILSYEFSDWLTN